MEPVWSDQSPAERAFEPLRAPARLSRETGAEVLEAVRARLADGATLVTVDLGPVESMDTQGAACLQLADRAARAQGSELRLTGAYGQVARLLELVRPSFEPPAPVEPRRVRLLESVGDRALRVLGEVREAGVLLVDSIFWAVLAPARGLGMRWSALWAELHEMGVRAIGIVALLNFLLGVIIALLSAAQLKVFGHGILVAGLVVIAFSRELACVMAAVIVSARTGAAITAELATMKVQEELDALRSMGINTAKFLVAPKLWALFLSLPALTVVAMVAGNLGGAFVGLGLLGEAPTRWWNEILFWAEAGDIMHGMSKSLIFAVIIALVGCHNGMRVRGGARGVGLATTRSVVMDIFFITVADMAFAAVIFFFE